MSQNGWAQNAANLTLLKDTILIGDQISLTINLQLTEPPKEIFFPKLEDSFNNIEVIERGKIDTQKSEHSYTYSQKITITSFDSGRYEIPSQIIRYIDQNGQEQNAMAQNIFLNVNTIAVDTSKDFKPINEILPQDAPDFWTRVKDTYAKNKLWFWLGGILLLLIVLSLVYFLFFRKKKTSQPQRIEVPYEKALRLLNELEAKQEWLTGDAKIYYTQLSEIVRNYLESSYAINAPEMTTRDLLKTVKKSSELRSIHQEMRTVLDTSDLAKFAKSIPTEEERAIAHKSAVKIVQLTKPKKEVVNDQ